MIRRVRIDSGRLHCLTCGEVVLIGAIESHRCPSRETMLADALQALADDDRDRALRILADLRRRLVADGLA